MRRHDQVVILARGRSRRMGRAKGLLRCPRPSRTSFLAAVVAGYRSLGLCGLVVTTPALVEAYAAEIPAASGFRVVDGPAGGDTARTMWRSWSVGGRRATHLWAHPVDLPLVQPSTLFRLGRASRRFAGHVVRPTWRGQPGHPVIVPTTVLEAPLTAALWRRAPMREVLALAHKLGHIEAPRLVAVGDRGVVQDFDRPTDLDLA